MNLLPFQSFVSFDGRKDVHYGKGIECRFRGGIDIPSMAWVITAAGNKVILRRKKSLAGLSRLKAMGPNRGGKNS